LSSRLRTIGVAILVAAVAFILHSAFLGSTPPSPGELELLQQAALVSNGSWSLFFQVSAERWLQPIPVYATALAGLIAPTDLAARYATAAAGALNVGLMFLVARRLFHHRLAPYGAAVLLLVTPAHLVHARLGTDAIYVLPFVLVWLICLGGYLRDGRTGHLVAGAFALGAGVYSQPAAPLTMMFLMAVSLAALGVSGRLSARTAGVSLATFALPLLLAAAWFAANPQSYADTFGRWAIHAAHLRFPLDAVRAFVNWTTLGTRVSLYWGFFDPSWLFFDGPSSAIALRGRAPFLLATLVLLVPGIRWALAQSAAVRVLLLGGLVVSPLAASTFGEPHAIHSAMAVIPLVLLLATAGATAALSTGSRTWRTVTWIAMAAGAADFARFYLSSWG